MPSRFSRNFSARLLAEPSCHIILFWICRGLCSPSDVEDYLDSKQDKREIPSQVEVRTVFINCENKDRQSDGDITRFERQELFKHNALRSCNKKLVLTVKMASDGDQSLGDEYIPIDHVFEGPRKKRVRLLNPYVLRLRRDPPLQAYKLRRIDTVTGVVSQSDGVGNTLVKKRVNSRNLREVTLDKTGSQAFWSVLNLEHDELGRNSYSVRVDSQEAPDPGIPTTQDNIQVSKNCGLRLFHERNSQSTASSLRSTRPTNSTRMPLVNWYVTSKFGIISQGPSRVQRETCVLNNASLYRRKRSATISTVFLNNSFSALTDNFDKNREIPDDLDEPSRIPSLPTDYNNVIDPMNHNYKLTKDIENSLEETSNEMSANKDATTAVHDLNNNNVSLKSPVKKEHSRKSNAKKSTEQYKSSGASEKRFALYDIGSPTLWYNVQTQLFEKTSSPEGRSIWNDLTRGQQACVSALNPEWSANDMHLRYRPTEWISREDFTLPTRTLSLLVPLTNNDFSKLDNETLPDNPNNEFIVVPTEDVVGLNDGVGNLNKRDENYSFSESREQKRVEVRVARALFNGITEALNVITLGSEEFLTIPHIRPHRAQIDLEVRADDNQLVRVGSSGCLATIVADSTRKSRTIITLQATNTGLASARFRVIARDCGPEISALIIENGSEGTMAGPVLLPPQHTRRLRLDLPIDMPVDVAHCSVALINDEEEPIAVREVAIRKGDRCFCVWHCDCVCLGEDPKLICREMSQPRQAAAGLPLRELTRQVRSILYSDCTIINLSVILFGVLIFLLTLGSIKAILGLRFRCIANWGLWYIIQMPRKLNCYHEFNLRDKPVIYDCDGWPIHPETKKRTVRILSRSIEFTLNVIMFIVLPFLIICNAVKQLFAKFRSCAKNTLKKTTKGDSKKCYSSRDIQSLELHLRRRGRAGLRRWMTPQAEELSADLWHQGLSPDGCSVHEAMRPLLHDSRSVRSRRDAGEPAEEPNSDDDCDSDQDDQYVLTQMQRSRESLARSQKIVSRPGTSITSARNHRKVDALPSITER